MSNSPSATAQTNLAQVLGLGATRTATGYRHEGYAASLARFGTPRRLPRSEGWVLERPIPGTPHIDGMGCYPLFSCRSFKALASDLDALGTELVSLALVADPFGDHEPELLRDCFPDVCYPFKTHYVVELERAPESFVSRAHQRNARRGLREVKVERCEKPSDALEDWVRLYDELIAHHGISGILAFSRASFEQQLGVPGLVALRASFDHRTVGMLLWFVHDEVAHYHLGAFDAIGYEHRASFALFWRSIELFRSAGLRWLNLGGGAGLGTDDGGGLSRFKAGWSTATREAWFCGRTFDPVALADLAAARGAPADGYFPPYRAGEFG